MSASETSPFPLVELQAVSNAQNEWVALAFNISAESGDPLQAALTLLKYPDLQAALAPLECIIAIPQPLMLEGSHLDAMPSHRVILRIPAAALADPAVQKKCSIWADAGYRIMVDGVAGMHATTAGARALMFDCSVTLPPVLSLVAQPGPHLATGVRDTD